MQTVVASVVVVVVLESCFRLVSFCSVCDVVFVVESTPSDYRSLPPRISDSRVDTKESMENSFWNDSPSTI